MSKNHDELHQALTAGMTADEQRFFERGRELGRDAESLVREAKASYHMGTPPGDAAFDTSDVVLNGDVPMSVAVAALKPANPKQAYGDLKVPVHTVPPALLLGAAKAFGEGAKKYGAFNWRLSKVEVMTYVGAIQRHLMAYLDGEDVDPESSTGKLHLEGIAACVGILLDCTYGNYLIDNRPPAGPAPRMVLTPKKETK